MDPIGNLYALLGVSPAATQEDIRKAYRTAASRYHPDVNRSPAASLIFREISLAYETLNDPSARAEYDLNLPTQSAGQTLNLSLLLSRTTITHLDEPQLVYTMLTLDPPSGNAVSGGTTPLNLALVIDRSTSMKGPRLDQVKAATHRIIDDLQDDDIVSVVSFSDRAEVVIPASRPHDRRIMKATVSTMRASGATAMYEGLSEGMRELSKSLHPRYINHLVLITDGYTYGDADACLEVADQAREEGLSISAMGIGEDWNDDFLDKLASRTGGSSAYVTSHRDVTAFLEDRVRSLGTAYAERSRLVVAPSQGVTLDSIFRVSPDPMPLDIEPQPIPLGMLDELVGTSLILQFVVRTEADSEADIHLGRILVYADILGSQRNEQAVVDLSVAMAATLPDQRPPSELIEALSKVTLYRLQQHARQALEDGDTSEATRSLELLATRLFEQGEPKLAQAALAEAQRVASTKVISDEGLKYLKYGTRALMDPSESETA